MQLRQEVEAPQQGVLPLVALLGESELEPREKSREKPPQFEPTCHDGCLSLLRVRVRFNDHRGHLRETNRNQSPYPDLTPIKNDFGQAPRSSKNTSPVQSGRCSTLKRTAGNPDTSACSANNELLTADMGREWQPK